MDKLLAKDDFAGLKKLIEDNKIKCAISGTGNWTDIRQFNLMFAPNWFYWVQRMMRIIKYTCDPETAQGIFVNFLNVPEDRPDENPVWYRADW